jgi:hypothetical protein
MLAARIVLALAVLAALGGVLTAAPPAPLPPATYDVVVNYRIVAYPNERIPQFKAMLKDLAAHGFRRDPNDGAAPDEAADSTATRLRGTVPAANARSLLLERHVRSLLLIPVGEKLPEAAAPVRVAIELAGGLTPDRERLLHAQTTEALGALKFVEAVGYDHRGFSRLVGTLPADQLDASLGDLRERVPGKDLPAPFANVRAIRIVEVRPTLPPPLARPNVPEVPQGQEKLSSELRETLTDEARAGQPLRFEIILADPPQDRDAGVERLLRATAPGISLEGILGADVTATGKPSQLAALAALPEVAGLRLPRPALAAPVRAGGDEAATLIATGLDRLHARGYRGKGSRLAVVAADFRGWEALLGKGLPKDTRLIDLTRERNRNLEPDPHPAGPGPGQGALFARIAAGAAPEAAVVLIRVDPAAPYMLQTVARAIHGDYADSLALEQRGRDLAEERAQLDLRRRDLLEERAKVFADLREEDDAIKRREAYQKNHAALDQDEDAFHRRLRRYLDLRKDLLQLKGVRVLASALVWDDGHTGGGSSPLSRFFDDRPFPSTLWIQPASFGRDRIWAGLFQDSDGNGVMEFTSKNKELPADSWSPELNFLAWQGDEGKPTADLPVGARVRVTFQWREAHDPALQRTGQDHFRDPLMNVRLVVLRQFDPSGAKQPADDFEVVAQSHGAPRRLDHSTSAATYEVSVEFRVAEAGRYALRVEGRAPDSDRPANLPTLPNLRRTGEVRPRIALETLDGAGRAIWRDFRGDDGAFGLPSVP